MKAPHDRRLVGLALYSLLMTCCLPAEAQQAGRIPQIGFISTVTDSSAKYLFEEFRKMMRELGYIDNKNIVIHYRYAEGNPDRLPDLAAELVRLRVDVVMATGGTPAILAAKRASHTIPIVFVGTNDPVVTGVVSSLARPGGNITGVTVGSPELYGKRLELLKDLVSDVSRIAFLWNPANISTRSALEEMQKAAKALNLHIHSLEVHSPDDFEFAFQAAARERADAIAVPPEAFFTANRKRIVALAAKTRLPAVYPWREYVEDGGLASYGTHLPDLYRRAALYVDRILKGTRPADLPVEQPTKFELAINLKTAKQIGLTIPPNVLARADKVIK